MANFILIEYLAKDIVIYQKMLNNPEYEAALKNIHSIVKFLNINSKSLYYQYQIVLNQLNDYNYYEATIFDRLKNPKYFNFIKNKISRKQNSNGKILKLTFKKAQMFWFL